VGRCNAGGNTNCNTYYDSNANSYSRTDLYADSYVYSDCNTDRYIYPDVSNAYSYGNAHLDTFTDSKNYSDSAASS